MMLENKKISDFCEMDKFEHLILKPTCFKGLLPSNHKQSFMGSDVYKIGILGHRKVIISDLRKTFAKSKQKTVLSLL